MKFAVKTKPKMTPRIALQIAMRYGSLEHSRTKLFAVFQRKETAVRTCVFFKPRDRGVLAASVAASSPASRVPTGPRHLSDRGRTNPHAFLPSSALPTNPLPSAIPNSHLQFLLHSTPVPARLHSRLFPCSCGERKPASLPKP